MQENPNILRRLGSAAIVQMALALVSVLLVSCGSTVGHAVPETEGDHSPPYDWVRDIVIDGETVRIPPTSGDHGNDLSPYGFSDGPLTPEDAVANMELGAAVIWFQPGDPTLAGSVFDLVSALGSECLVAGSFADMSVDVAATAWGRVLPQSTYDGPALVDFVNAYRGSRGPSSGLCKAAS